MKFQGQAGNGTGVQKFSIKPGGIGLQLADPGPTPLQAAVAAPEIPELPDATTTEPVAPQTPFNKMYPGLDPSKVQMDLDPKSNKIRFKPIAAPADVAPVETPAAPIIPAVPIAPTEPDAIAQLRAELAQQSQIQTAMLTALATGRPLMEVLSGAPAAAPEPDYSRYDLADDDERAEFVKQVRADAKAAAQAAAQAELNAVRPSMQDTQRHSERFAVQAEHGADPNYNQLVAMVEKRIGNNPNISFRATYNLFSEILNEIAPTPARQNGHPILTPAQQAEKAAQAARYQQNNGGRANGPPSKPEGVKTFKQHAAWTAHMLALGYTPEQVIEAGKR